MPEWGAQVPACPNGGIRLQLIARLPASCRLPLGFLLRPLSAAVVEHIASMATVAALTAAHPPLVTHVSPAKTGPLGGSVLLFHGAHLPYLAAMHADVTFAVGGAACPFLPARSDPRGSFLACGPVPAVDDYRSADMELTVPATVQLNTSGVQDRSNGLNSSRLRRLAMLPCARCALIYSPRLRAEASLSLSHLRGAAGDVLTVVGLGEWRLLSASYGHHEQVRIAPYHAPLASQLSPLTAHHTTPTTHQPPLPPTPRHLPLSTHHSPLLAHAPCTRTNMRAESTAILHVCRCTPPLAGTMPSLAIRALRR